MGEVPVNAIKKLLKCATALVAALVLSVSVSACGNSGDAVLVRDLVQATFESLAAPTKESLSQLPVTTTVQKITEYGIDPVTFLTYCFKNLTYEVEDVKVDGNKADVSLTVTNIPISTALDTAAKRYDSFESSADAQKLFEEKGESGLFAKLFEFLYESIDAGGITPVTTEVVMHCEKGSDGNWKVSTSGNQEFFSAIFGGADPAKLL